MNRSGLSDALSGPPVDFTFKCINSVEDILLKEPRPGPRAIKCSEDGKLMSQALNLSYNTLTDIRGFREVVNKLLVEPNKLSWIDLSFNNLSAIDSVLTGYCNLSILNLHGNSIRQFSQVDKLAALPNLKRLTLHGNPIDEEQSYRSYVLSVLPQLKSLDFCAVSKQDRVTANTWRRMNIRPRRVRRVENK
ncbi:hypothetical protein GDO86_007557 [Hymenochirus boettgeri]|uniref:Leucine-rich repeat-containing protein 51 n=1 Tax=Hymenochirus boettgeri TaxID=247094 RepID=A0A8T2IZK6_9PIPI|nr:hypothetical protein GDO86_007557 [Hymenochirus boettgeri]